MVDKEINIEGEFRIKLKNKKRVMELVELIDKWNKEDEIKEQKVGGDRQ